MDIQGNIEEELGILDELLQQFNEVDQCDRVLEEINKQIKTYSDAKIQSEYSRERSKSLAYINDLTIRLEDLEGKKAQVDSHRNVCWEDMRETITLLASESEDGEGSNEPDTEDDDDGSD